MVARRGRRSRGKPVTRSGPIQAERAEERIDQRAEIYALWERGADDDFSPPSSWAAISSSKRFDDAARIVSNACVVTLAVGSTEESRALLHKVLESVRPHSRLYVFGDRNLERDAESVDRIAHCGDRALVRLGPRPPADWLTVDRERDGRFFVGPGADSRRWAIPVGDRLARSLFSAFHALFWFHADREALPDADGSHAFRSPLDAPFEDPGSDVLLPAGRLRIGAGFDDPIAEAEVRISPSATDLGRSRLYFLPPGDGPMSLRIPEALHNRGGRTVWTDTGLPTTTVSRNRMAMDMAVGPVALRLEWPAADAVALLNCLEDAARRPTWEFHAARRLDEVKKEVLLDGAFRPAAVEEKAVLNAGDAPAALLDFDAARPPSFPDPPPLVLEATVEWRRIPARAPSDARPAKIVEDWTKVDEWARRVGDDLRRALEDLERLGGGAPPLDYRTLLEELAEIRESPPSETPDRAPDDLARLAEIARRANEAVRAAPDRRPDVEASDRASSKKSFHDGPARRTRRTPVDASACPPVPAEELPELGELYEYRGKRFLEISTWEQLGPAIPVAKRLRAELVASRSGAGIASP